MESVPAAYSRRQEAKKSAHQCDSARSGVVSSRGVGEQFGFGVVERVQESWCGWSGWAECGGSGGGLAEVTS